MCGIAGAFQQPDGKVIATTMIERLLHRGPDAGGVLEIVDPSAAVFLAHRRLSIIDLSSAADQPLSRDGLSLSYNGELYNYREIRRDLEGRGVAFATNSDTEVVLEAWRTWGVGSLERFRGMFAFAVYDAGKRSLTLARDPFGIKPLYTMRRGEGVVFASELKAIMAALGPELTVDPAGMVASTLFYWLPPAYDAVREVRKLPAGSWTEYRQDGSTVSGTYWNAAEEAARAAAGPQVDLAACIRSSVDAHLVSDVPVAAFLSGGLDSSILTALAHRSDPSIEAYTIAFRDEDQRLEAMPDDAYYARRLADHLGIRLHEIEIKPDVVDLLPRMVDILDEPVGDPAAINTLLMCEAARDAGVKVLLSGMGADELFGGYRKHLANKLTASYRRIPSHVTHRCGRPARGPAAGRGCWPRHPHGALGEAVPHLRRAPRRGGLPPQLHPLRPRRARRPGGPGPAVSGRRRGRGTQGGLRGQPARRTRSVACAWRTPACSCRGSTSPTPTAPAWRRPPRSGCRSSTRSCSTLRSPCQARRRSGGACRRRR